jgi:hypothetical protein
LGGEEWTGRERLLPLLVYHFDNWGWASGDEAVGSWRGKLERVLDEEL